MKKTLVIIFSVLGAAVVAVTAVFASLYYTDRVREGFDEDFVIRVYPDSEPHAILDEICLDGRAKSRRSMERCFKSAGTFEKIKPGYYPVKSSYTAIYVARMLAFGWQEPCTLTLSGTLRTKGRIAKAISSQMMVDSLSIAAALDDELFLYGYGFNPQNVFALIVPDSYEMYWTASVQDIFDRFRKEYDKFWTPERDSLARKQGLSRMEVSIMASIVNGETLQKDEYPVIAGVYLNRLRKGIKLQADPTVCYCFDYSLNRVLKKHLQVDSPFNTYKYAGLPPAPINVPPKACIDAVLSPSVHNYIYFCASPEFNGRHRFAATYSEHLKNAREFQSALTKREKQRRNAEQ